MLTEKPERVFSGFDAGEMEACNGARQSLYHFTPRNYLNVETICRLRVMDVYRRPTSRMQNGQLFDEISGAPMSTDHAIARFFVPYLMNYLGWALFTDGDVLFRDDVRKLFDLADPRYAVQVVQHPPMRALDTKKDGHVQQLYSRKNWSSVILWNCLHPAHEALTLETLNTWPGRDLHAYKWLKDSEIGMLPARWNWLVGESRDVDDPAIVHYTLGTPLVPRCVHAPYADEWRDHARKAGYHPQMSVDEVL